VSSRRSYRGPLQGGTRRRRPPPLLTLLALIVCAAGVVAASMVAFGRESKEGTGAPRAAGGDASRRPAQTQRRPDDDDYYAAIPAPATERVSGPGGRLPRAGMLWDLRTGQVLWSWGSRRTRPIASVTKMMTALVVVERERPAARLLVTKAALRYQGSGVGLLPANRRVPAEPLLYGLLLPSGNDAARVLAQNVGGTIPRFVRMMNARARELGLRCSHFTDPSGYDDRNRSCPRDLAKLTRAVMREPRIRRVVRTRNAALPFPIKGGKLHLSTHNPLLAIRYRGTTGVKTGYSPAAGLCFVATARRGSTELGAVLLGSPNPGQQARRLLDRGFVRLAASRARGPS
jgi:serine-type D-Ala-D-Ala carboxypeptidase (penicillin-binding protein 5/6)